MFICPPLNYNLAKQNIFPHREQRDRWKKGVAFTQLNFPRETREKRSVDVTAQVSAGTNKAERQKAAVNFPNCAGKVSSKKVRATTVHAATE